MILILTASIKVHENFLIECGYSVPYWRFIPSGTLMGNGALIQFAAECK